MRSRLRPSGFSHSRSFSAPTVPSLRLTPPTPHRSYHHEKDYDPDDSIPTSAAAMPRPNRYRRPSPRTSGHHPYAINGQSSPSPTFPHEQYQSVNPGFFRGQLDGKTIAAFSIVIAPDGYTVTIQGQLVPKPAKYPSQDVQERRSLSQPASPVIFQSPIEHSVAALGLQNPPNSPTDGETVPPKQQPRLAPEKPEHAVPLAEDHSQFAQMYLDQYNAYLTQYQTQQQWMWPVEQIPASHA
ncbi:hypothetical protein DPSP01_004085 [Paraphaeosphaeria sporulosa]|uniref:Uncharacterized protein n=1 Tax=Paraphaeosphaeria sporulosa TaxID=1460663 RepID=A0A177CAW0_9PLEO|nr:uncharacterized protein CC84DRAFT_1206313 [Paraphaeosphaeria sporulosa]OAG04705.1 hypothetical protein CC84DRAFT_1206313 [Paraphaeosphaeria sporulosa]